MGDTKRRGRNVMSETDRVFTPLSVDPKRCATHSQHASRIHRNEDDIQDIWRAIDHMKTWVILGMGALLLQLILYVGKILLNAQ